VTGRTALIAAGQQGGRTSRRQWHFVKRDTFSRTAELGDQLPVGLAVDGAEPDIDPG